MTDGSKTMQSESKANFIYDFIDEDNNSQRYGKRVHTRFPPEPNGYLHIGHAKAVVINFSTAQKYGGKCNLRFDDTNPSKEDVEYVNSIQKDIKWLGYNWDDMFFASDYFDRMYGYAIELIEKGLAYVCDLSADEIREYRGTLTEPGRDSPYRDRTVAENLDLFKRMYEGEFEDGAKVLRAKIDMSSPNINMRDPVIYRILTATHHRTGDKWRIYPMYDYAHPLEDAIEGITHSLCSLEFEDHRPLYEWIINNTSVACKSRQIEFARLNLTYTVMSKRKLLKLVQDGCVCGWDDPRMPTLSGMCRRGYPPEAIRDFCGRIGVAKTYSTVDFALLEHCVRENLNAHAPRAMAVLNPVKLTVENYEEGLIEEFEADINPEDPGAGKRKMSFSRELYVEAEDFAETPPKGWFRLSPGREARLKYAYYVTCTGFKRDGDGNLTEIICEYDPESKGGGTPDGRKVRGALHWVSKHNAVNAEIRLYDNLFNKPDPEGDEETPFTSFLSEGSLKVLKNCKLEPWIVESQVEERFQFLRMGYFCIDNIDHSPATPVYNRIVTLKDSYVKTLGKL
ncbi:MAG: glutamine--tRNA ligase/YqeY domain fusion protein [Oscillospiraceae bacterium]|nr:glutamine--tRNA ligase/YqeY domain fusion protein [Oscillospiraceae bacterium]